MPLLTLDLGLGAAAEVVAVADTRVHLGSAQARAHTGDRTSTSGKRRNKIICDRNWCRSARPGVREVDGV